MTTLDKCFWCKECDKRTFYELPRGEWGHKCMAKHKDTGKPLGECESFIDVIEGIPTVSDVADEYGRTFGFICRGHDVTPEQFAAGIWWSWGEDYDLDVADIAERMRRTIYRLVPSPLFGGGVYHESKPGRGAFKCTVYYFD